jgi:hypothetical protein
MITIGEALIIAVLTLLGYAFIKTLVGDTNYNIKLKLLISIDEWDKYTAEWDISEDEVVEYKVNDIWVLQTNEEIANVLVNQNIAVPFK